MVHRLALCFNIPYAFKHPNGNNPVRKHKSEKSPFGCGKLGFFIFQFFYLLFLVRFGFLHHIAVVGGFEVYRTYIFSVMQVFPEKAKKVYIVAPKRGIVDFVAVADADTDSRPIVVYLLPIAVHMVLMRILLHP